MSRWKQFSIRIQGAGFGLALAAGLGGSFFFVSAVADAGTMEISLGFSYSHSNYSDDNYSWSRRWGASVGYHITELTEIEAAFQDIWERTKITNYEDTTFHDQIYSANIVQALLGKEYAVQPYFKAGVGQLNREATGTYAGGASPPAILDSVTVILGLGLRVFLTRTIAIRTELTSYLTGGKISSYQDNLNFTVGASFFF